MHPYAKVQNCVFHPNDYLEKLIISGHIDKFLCQIVSEWIPHQLSESINYFSKNDLKILRVFLYCLLKITASTLVFAELKSVCQ